MIARLRALFAAPVTLWVALLVVQRLFAVLLLRPGGYFYDFSDTYTFWLYARTVAEGYWPFRDFWVEYPPLFPLFNQSLYLLALRLPPLAELRFWHHLLLGLALLPFEAGVLILLHRLALRLWDTITAERVAVLWLLLFVPLFIWQSFFDVLPLFGLLAALWAMDAGRPLSVGVAVAFGFLTKLLSVLALPTALQVFAQGRGWRGLLSRQNVILMATFTGICVLVFVPLLMVGPEWLAATVRNFGGRGAWQTVYALIDGYYGSGLVRGDRFDPTPIFEVQPSRIPWPLIHLLFAALGLWLWTRPWQWALPKVQVAFTALVVCLFFLWSKGWSPQFTLILLPFILLLFPTWRGLALILLFSTLMVAENLYYNAWVYRSDRVWPLFVIILARTAALIYLAWLSYGQLERRDATQPIAVAPSAPLAVGEGA